MSGHSRRDPGSVSAFIAARPEGQVVMTTRRNWPDESGIVARPEGQVVMTTVADSSRAPLGFQGQKMLTLWSFE